MRQCYIIQCEEIFKVCIADLSPPGVNDCLHWHMHRINVPYQVRGKGKFYGRRLLAAILADADAEGEAICLWPVPSGGWSRDDLIKWYERHGFVKQGGKCGWVRYPVEIPNRQEEH